VTAFDRVPYPGLRAFKREETDLFFGRDDSVGAMIERLAVTRFLAVLGSSGTGKSSLAKTALPAALRMGLVEDAGSKWRIVEFRPEGTPLGNLARGLLAAMQSEKGESSKVEVDVVEVNLLRARLGRGPRSLIEWCHEGNLPPGTNLLILVDQFEELFRYDEAGQNRETEAFIALLLESRYPTGVTSLQDIEFPIYIALTLRSEYLGACAFFTDLTEAINGGSYLVPRMTREQCREAIVGPATVCGAKIEPALTNRLLNDLGSFAPWDTDSGADTLSVLARRADQLPVMQHALNQLWRNAEREANDKKQAARSEIVLTLKEYEAIGEISGALDQHANAILEQLGPERAQVIEAVFRALTRGTTVADAVRRPTPFGELVKLCNGDENGVRAVIEAFRAPGRNFLIPDVDDESILRDETMVDVAHESLIRQWKTLSRWLEKEGRAAHEWQRLKEDADRGSFIYWQQLRKAVRLKSEVKPTAAWAERYGGGFDKVTRLIARSQWLQRTLLLTAAFAVVLGLLAGFTIYRKNVEASQQAERAKQQAAIAAQQTGIANGNFELAVKSAQKLLNSVSASVDRGEITLKGADAMMMVAAEIATQVHDVEKTKRTVSLLVNLAITSSDISASVGDNSQAFVNAQKAEQLLQPLRVASPNDPQVLQLLYNSILREGDAISIRGRAEAVQREALARFVDAEKLARRLMELAPEEFAYKRAFVIIQQKIGDVDEALNDFAGAIAEYKKALPIITEALAQAPKDRSWLRELATTQDRIGQTLSDTPDFAGALGELNAALAIRNDLAASDHDDLIVLSHVAGSHQRIAELYAQHGQLDAASKEYKVGIDIQDQLVAHDRENATYLSPLAALRLGLGDILARQGMAKDALAEYRKGYDIRLKLALKDLRNPGAQNALAKAEVSVADQLVALKEDLDEALNLYRDAVPKLDETRPRSRYDTNIIDAHLQIGDILVLKNDRGGALKSYETALATARESVAANPGSLSRQKRLAAAESKISDLKAVQTSSSEAGHQ
jgi:tetratricopeptide (TPR) repeat protein